MGHLQACLHNAAVEAMFDHIWSKAEVGVCFVILIGMRYL